MNTVIARIVPTAGRGCQARPAADSRHPTARTHPRKGRVLAREGKECTPVPIRASAGWSERRCAGCGMSVDQYCARVRQGSLGRNDQQWFPAWFSRYAEAVQVERGALPVTRETVIDLLRGFRSGGTPAWQRLQTTRAIEAYQSVGSRDRSAFFARHTKHSRPASQSARGSGVHCRAWRCRPRPR